LLCGGHLRPRSTSAASIAVNGIRKLIQFRHLKSDPPPVV
jgi:hypothetical protein